MENDFLFELGLRGFLGVHDYDIKVPKDRRLMFLTGPNGYGKTEILRMLDCIAGEANPANELILADEVSYRDEYRNVSFIRRDEGWTKGAVTTLTESWAKSGKDKRPLTMKRLSFPMSDMREFNSLQALSAALVGAWESEAAVKFREIVERYEPEVWVASGKREAFFRYTKTGREIPFLNLSDGEKSLVILLGRLLFNTHPGTVHLIDNPTVFMHVSWAFSLAKDMEACLEMNNGYALVATHSPQLINESWDNCIDLFSLENPEEHEQ